MADWNDIKNAFERDAEKAAQRFKEDEQSLLKSVTHYVFAGTGVSAVQSYNTTEIIHFLQKPVTEIKSCLGGDWLKVSDDKLSTLSYSLLQKVKKSNLFVQW